MCPAALQVGSIYEYANKNPVFGVVKPDNFLWAPILLFFAISGFPSAGTVYSVCEHSPKPQCCLLKVIDVPLAIHHLYGLLLWRVPDILC